MLLSYGFICGASPHLSTRKIELLEERLHALLTSLISLVEVDENWYISQNPDVERAIREGLFTSAKQHYVKSGYFEDRMPHDIKVNEDWYLKTYPDVANAIQLGVLVSGAQHFARDGFREGRLPYDGFSLITLNSMAA
ncbi:MAG: hypothetical protein B7Z78_05105 [Rhodospirillales bacterium 20-60-12]|nr:MAG: hypothetical protein B7Z78_05105 [Rhodospirillales bacterium 20-60-12]HQT66775.1 hypothetical protein [Acetobacteraceae bacterium]